MQQTAITRELIQALALANGLNLPDDRVDVVLEQYESYLRTIEELDSLSLPQESEPAILFSLPSDGSIIEPPPRR